MPAGSRGFPAPCLRACPGVQTCQNPQARPPALTTTTDTTDLTTSDDGVAVPTDDYDHLHAGDSATDSGTDSTTVPADGSWLENARAVILPMVFKVQA